MLHPQLLCHERQYEEPDYGDKEVLLVATPVKGTGDREYRVPCLRAKSGLSLI